VIRSLRSDSPITADLETRARQPEHAYAEKLVVANFVRGLYTIEHESVVPPYFSEFALGRVKSIAQNLTHKGEATRLRVAHIDEEVEAEVTEQAAVNVTKALAPATTGIGSVTGSLEVISLRGSPHVNVYDSLTHRAVRCKFAEEDLDRIKEAFGSRVTVSGIIYRNKQGHAVRMEKTQVNPAPPEEKLPKSRDLKGLVPDFTGEMTTEEYIRELRD
ncbi:MAG: hypothetical protein M3280_00820, partial [Actinomycetota bacterium]|nr:hypothetical protein [Actinomycetota bacterium]